MPPQRGKEDAWAATPPRHWVERHLRTRLCRPGGGATIASGIGLGLESFRSHAAAPDWSRALPVRAAAFLCLARRARRGPGTCHAVPRRPARVATREPALGAATVAAAGRDGRVLPHQAHEPDLQQSDWGRPRAGNPATSMCLVRRTHPSGVGSTPVGAVASPHATPPGRSPLLPASLGASLCEI